MGIFYETIPTSLQGWIKDQKVFWIATAPLSGQGHVNLSPKGGPHFGLVDDGRTFWYLDLTGSGNETISHLHEPNNARVTVLFNAFEGPPKIVRLFGKGHVLENKTQEFDTFITTHFSSILENPLPPGIRSIILVEIHQVGKSCGYSVPYYDFREFRSVLDDHFARKEARFRAGDERESMDRYWAMHNAYSVDQLPGMRRAMEVGKREGIVPVRKMKGGKAMTTYSMRSDGSHAVSMVVVLVAVLGLVVLGLAVLTSNGPTGTARWWSVGEGGARSCYIPTAHQLGGKF